MPKCKQCGKDLLKYCLYSGDYSVDSTAPGSGWKYEPCSCVAQKPTKNCGNCRWWDRENPIPPKIIKRQDLHSMTKADCLWRLSNTLPKSIYNNSLMFKCEGSDCPCHEPRTDDGG